MNNPQISVIIPSRNEELFISNCISSLLSNNYPGGKVEILIIDGNSTDSTLKILNEIVETNSNVRVISNPKKIFAAAVNIGVRHASGDYIFIAGAHAIYPDDYLLKCVTYSLKYDADNVGGILETIPIDDSLMGALVAKVLSSPFGVGNSKFRTGSSEIIETDTVFGGCYKKDVFQKYGYFNENLVSTSDYEYNKRIKREGARILLVPEIKCVYYTRSTLLSFIKNNFRNGLWAIYPLAFTEYFPVSIRHIVPLIFVITLMTTLCLSFISELFLIMFISILILYLLLALTFSLQVAGKKKYQIPILPLLFISLHLVYGLGSFWGVFKVIFSRIRLIYSRT